MMNQINYGDISFYFDSRLSLLAYFISIVNCIIEHDFIISLISSEVALKFLSSKRFENQVQSTIIDP